MGNRDRSGHTGADSKIPLFHKPLETLEVPVPLMGSLEDNMRRKNLAEEYQQMSQQIPDCKIHLFSNRGTSRNQNECGKRRKDYYKFSK